MTAKIPLPQEIDPWMLTEKGETLQGNIPLSQMQRLNQLLNRESGDAQIALKFDKDREGYRQVIGSITARLMLTCQRCMRPVDYDVNVAVSLSLVLDINTAKKLPDRYEPLLVTREEPILLAEMSEEELLLSLPIVVKHQDEAVCSVERKN